ncbi:hypothetical protein TNCV_463531 [Trichonephila clavipes]|nr:hypothetical protein TNCV_463531 [Trichonephila clavipes]
MKLKQSILSSTSEMQRQVIDTGIVLSGNHVGHSTADTDGLSDAFKQIRYAADATTKIRSVRSAAIHKYVQYTSSFRQSQKKNPRD